MASACWYALAAELQLIPGPIVLPTKTTCTLAKAAVAAKISTLLADVNSPRHIEKIAENPSSTTSRSIGCRTKYKVKIEAAGITDARMTPTR